MPRFTVVTVDIDVTFMIMYYKYVRTYYTSVSMRVEFNLNIMIKRTI